MLRERPNAWRRLNLLGDLFLTEASLLGCIFIFKPALPPHTITLLAILTAGVWEIFLYGPSGSYFYRMKSVGKVFKELYWALGKSFLVFISILYFLQIPAADVLVVVFFIADGLVLTILRLSLLASLRYYRIRGKSNRNVIVVGTGTKAREIADRICDNRAWGLHIIGFLDYHRTGLWRYRDKPLIGHPDGLADIISINQVDYLIIAADKVDMPLTDHAFAVGEEMGVTVCVISDFYFHPISQARPSHFLDMPTVIYTSAPHGRFPLAAKGLLDWLGGLIGLLFSLPVTLVAAVAIKLEDGGPVFFRQVRSGRNGKPFTMYKFRTMVPNAEALKEKLQTENEMSGPVFKIRNDPRITRVGAFLRKTSVDELPQFINILKGEMSLVGPRPPLPQEVAQYDRWQRRKLAVKPGLTCLWQVNGRNQIDFEDWMKLDLDYIDHWSLWLDTKILLKTVPAVFKGNGAH